MSVIVILENGRGEKVRGKVLGTGGGWEREKRGLMREKVIERREQGERGQRRERGESRDREERMTEKREGGKESGHVRLCCTYYVLVNVSRSSKDHINHLKI